MLTHRDQTPHFGGVHRRDFLRLGACGAGLGLAGVLGRPASAVEPPRRRKSAILIHLPGGPSHLDTFDPKPAAPAEYRGEFQSIATTLPGVRVCEHLPLLAGRMEKLALVRSLTSVDEHSDSLTLTGHSEVENRRLQHPSFGAVVSKMWESDASMPPFVSLRGPSIGAEPGFLGAAHRAYTADGPGVANLRSPAGVDAARHRDRKALLAAFSGEGETTGAMQGVDALHARAFAMTASPAVHAALDLSKEDPRTRDRYRGVEQFLTARRLVEAGVGCVTLACGSWDTHDRNFEQHRRHLPALDRGLASLIDDLHDRGLADDVVTVAWGEFGRTPRVNQDGGRDHWAPVMSAVVAGGGLKVGQVVGGSTARGEYPKDRPLTVPQMLATLYTALGIDPALTLDSGTGRPVALVDTRDVVRELLG